MRKNKLIKKLFAIFFLCIAITTNVYAVEWWDQATEWKKEGDTSVEIKQTLIDDIAETVEIIGTAIIAIATVVVGIKYIFGTVQGKVEAKESLMNLLVACIFFFGWSAIRGLLITGSATAKGGYSLVFFNGDIKTTFASIFTLVSLIGKIVTVVAIGYMGVKYIFAGADAKAEIKQKSPALIIGVILIFCTTTFLGKIAEILTDVLK